MHSSCRFTKERTILFGLWFGKEKPQLTSFLRPIVNTWNDLQEKGVDVNFGSSRIKMKVKILAATMDLPAMSMLKEVKQFNGEYGCGICEEKGVRTKKGKGTVNAYVYRSPSKQAPLRTAERMKQHASQAKVLGKPVFGVKRRSMVSFVKGFNYASDVMVDYLHGICIGVTKALLKLWLTNKKQPYYIGDKLDMVDERLANIKPPDNVTRNPRSLANELSDFKASEYRALLLYYGLVAFRGVLPEKYFEHFAMLSTAIYLLLTDEVTAENRRTAQDLLTRFHMLYVEYYGAENCTINLHNACAHIVKCVELAGPLWAFGCFNFESNCGTMARFVHGTRYVGMQIVNGYHMLQRIHSIGEVIRSQPVRDVIMRVQNKRQRNEQCPELGKLKRLNNESYECKAIADLFQCRDAVVHSFSRLVRCREILISEDWKRQKTKNSTVISYFLNGTQQYGCISRFLRVTTDTNTFNVASITPSEVTEENAFSNDGQIGKHTKKIKFIRSKKHIIKIEDIGRRMVVVSEGYDEGTIIPVVNSTDHD
ncbi:uncharacterized protein LOC117111758 [Anneissia japonica]|uniref:uncharacterized protein LOC117111758 n=1 Tax=Anneissia japonica TaxID=1529436 RepID=UPI0014254E08|nr:uncharacterized protein LOC117111758 [Anneissia japonica]